MAALYRRLGPRTLLFVALACNARIDGRSGGPLPFAVLFASWLVQAVGTGAFSFIPMMNAILETVASEKLGSYLARGQRHGFWPRCGACGTGALIGASAGVSVFVVPLVVSALIGLWGLVAVRPSRRGDIKELRLSSRGAAQPRFLSPRPLLSGAHHEHLLSLTSWARYLEECAHLGPALSGLCLGPLVVAYAVASLAGGRRLDRRGPALAFSGLAVAAAGSVLMAVAAWMASEITLLAGMLVVFVGCGTVCANFQTTGAAVPGAEPALPGRHHNDDGRPNCCFYRTVCLGGHNVGHPRCVGEAQSALAAMKAPGYSGPRLCDGLASRLLGLSTAVEMEAQQC